MRYMAVARMVDHWDDIGAWLCLGEAPCTNKNYYWYASTESDQVWFIPWDMDHTLEPASRNRPRNNNVPEWDDVDAGCELVEFRTGRYYRPPACDTLIGGMATGSRELYVAYSNELLNGPFSVESMNARIDALETLLMPYILEDPYEDVDAWQEALTELRSTVVAKREFVQRRL